VFGTTIDLARSILADCQGMAVALRFGQAFARQVVYPRDVLRRWEISGDEVAAWISGERLKLMATVGAGE
jgi:hypothetical protein